MRKAIDLASFDLTKIKGHSVIAAQRLPAIRHMVLDIITMGLI
jgi:hypothetical protein